MIANIWVCQAVFMNQFALMAEPNAIHDGSQAIKEKGVDFYGQGSCLYGLHTPVIYAGFMGRYNFETPFFSKCLHGAYILGL